MVPRLLWLLVACGGLAGWIFLFYTLPVLAFVCLGIQCYAFQKALTYKAPPKAIEPAKVDGRTHKEWYDLIRLMGREEYEKLSRPALDGLEESEYGWDAKRLLGSEYNNLMVEWYPEKYCSFCKNRKNENGNCFWDGPCIDAAKHSVIKTRSTRGPGLEIRPEGVLVESEDGTQRLLYPPKPAKPVVSITEMTYRPGIKKYRIRHGDKEYVATQQQIAEFQRYKHLPSDGIPGWKTKNALDAYLNAGNPWPVSRGRLQSEEAKKIANELVKWRMEAEGKLSMHKELMRDYNKNGGYCE